MIEKYGALLHRRWELKDGKIIGFWAEDDSEYEVIIPEQLQSKLLDIQHGLCDIYIGVQSAEAEASRLANSFKSIMGV